LIVHRDLKPENILLDRNCNVKISDFGFANIITPGEKFRSFCGSLLYAAPEILAGLPYSGPFVDLWSLGVILYTMVCGRQPFTGESPQEAIAKILNVQYEFPDYLSEDCRDLIRKLLVKEEKKRLPISAIRQHDWVNVGYLRPPPSYLRVSDYNAPVSSIYEEIMQQLTELGFHDTPEARKEILCGRKTQLVATYHALLNRLTHPKDAVVVPSPLKRSPSPLSRSPPKHTAVETRKRANSVDELKLPALNLKQSSPQPTSALSPRLRVISRQSKSATAIRRLASSPPKGETVEKSASPSPPLSPRSRLISSPTKSATTIRPLSSSPLKEIAEEPLLPLKEGDTSDFSELSAPRKDPWSAPVYGGPRLANANSGYLDILD
jgi:serine/threonine protein kinase